MRKLLLIFVLFIFGSCACYDNVNNPSRSVPKGRYQDIPAWFINFPKGDFTIGIAQMSTSDPAVKNSALQNATVNYSRNKHCYVVHKKAVHKSEITIPGGENEFQVVVTSSPETLEDIRDKLILIDFFWFYNNFVGLYSMHKTAVDTNRISTWIDEQRTQTYPEWFKTDIFRDDGRVYSDVHASSHDFVSAFRKAFNEARIKLASYSKIKVESKVYAYNGDIDKLVALETNLKMMNIDLNNIYSRFYQSPGGHNYSVYLRMSIKDFID